MKNLPDLFEKNRKWAEQVRKKNPGFFEELSKGQSPDYLWIGCSDSRVPPTQIVDLKPGDMFVHRNIANVVRSDLNSQSVIQFAVEVLKVKHIIVCGHYSCGGVTAVIEDQQLGLINNWLEPIKDVYSQHLGELKQIESPTEKINRLCEINVQAQVKNVAQSPSAQKAWKEGQELSIHGWIYSLVNGHINDLDLSISSSEEVPSL